jgi:hypothetical protein
MLSYSGAALIKASPQITLYGTFLGEASSRLLPSIFSYTALFYGTCSKLETDLGLVPCRKRWRAKVKCLTGLFEGRPQLLVDSFIIFHPGKVGFQTMTKQKELEGFQTRFLRSTQHLSTAKDL